MKILRWMVPAIVFFLVACQPQTSSVINIIDGDNLRTINSSERVPSKILAQVNIILAPKDVLLSNGLIVALDQPLPSANSYTLQIRRAVTITVNGQTMQSAANTVGEMLAQAGTKIYQADKINPAANTPLTNNLNITYIASREFTISVDKKQIRIRSAAATVGGALAEAGIPLIGLDASQPSENEALPQDGQIRIVRISESVTLAEKSIPFQSTVQTSPDVELDQQEILQPGIPGLAVSRIRIRYQDGVEISRQVETSTVVRPPKDRIVAYGTKAVLHTATVDGVQIQYWRAVQMFATAYSPCNSAADRCYPATASGKPVQQGVVAVLPSWYANMRGQGLYIPGYGSATIEDIGGGIPGKLWIDLGYTDAQYASEGGQWGRYVTVYFLAPIPNNIMYVLQ
jgi:uncharacterized protein YabE (DUF348 family)